MATQNWAAPWGEYDVTISEETFFVPQGGWEVGISIASIYLTIHVEVTGAMDGYLVAYFFDTLDEVSGARSIMQSGLYILKGGSVSDIQYLYMNVSDPADYGKVRVTILDPFYFGEIWALLNTTDIGTAVYEDGSAYEGSWSFSTGQAPTSSDDLAGVVSLGSAYAFVRSELPVFCYEDGTEYGGVDLSDPSETYWCSGPAYGYNLGAWPYSGGSTPPPSACWTNHTKQYET